MDKMSYKVTPTVRADSGRLKTVKEKAGKGLILWRMCHKGKSKKEKKDQTYLSDTRHLIEEH